MINMTVAESTIRKGLKAGVVIAAGASLVEFVQAFIAVKFTSLFINSAIENSIQWLSILIFTGLALYFAFSKTEEKKAATQQEENSNTSDFFKGVVISALNIIVFPYWVFYASYFSAMGWLANNLSLFLFVAGVMFGTFSILYLYARLSLKIIDSVQKIAHYTNRIMAGLFFIFALIQLLRLTVFSS